jgi:hypothetical protein
MPPEVLSAANEWGVWIIAMSVIGAVLLQALLYMRLAFRSAGKIGFERGKCVQALRSGLVLAIGPSIGVFIVMVGMMAVVGAPMTWIRLSIIGSAPTEQAAATIGAAAYGVPFGGKEYTMMALACSWWAMAINGCGWLVFCAFFTDKLEKIRTRIGGGNGAWLAILSGAAMLGAFAFLNARGILKIVPQASGGGGLAVNYGALAAALGGGLSMILFVTIARKVAWLREYALGFAMLVGMAVAMGAKFVVEAMGGKLA